MYKATENTNGKKILVIECGEGDIALHQFSHNGIPNTIIISETTPGEIGFNSRQSDVKSIDQLNNPIIVMFNKVESINAWIEVLKNLKEQYLNHQENASNG